MPTSLSSSLSILTPAVLAVIAGVVIIVGILIAATRRRRKAPSTPTARVSYLPKAIPPPTLDSKVAWLKKMLDEGLITQKEYDEQVERLSGK
jgi:hypothetical protein